MSDDTLTTRRAHNIVCPFGCGHSIVLDGEGVLSCKGRECPDPRAIEKIFDQDAVEHIVHLTHNDFGVIHPLRERIDGVLLDDCPLIDYMNGLAGPPKPVGRYIVSEGMGKGNWYWTTTEG